MDKDDTDIRPKVRAAMWKLGANPIKLQEDLLAIEAGLLEGTTPPQVATQFLIDELELHVGLKNNAVSLPEPEVREEVIRVFERVIEDIFAFAEQHQLELGKHVRQINNESSGKPRQR